MEEQKAVSAILNRLNYLENKANTNRGVGKKKKKKLYNSKNINSTSLVTSKRIISLDQLDKDYICALTNNFMANNIRLGFGTMSETELVEPWLNNTITTTAAVDTIIYQINPDASLSVSTNSTGQLVNFVTANTFLGTTLVSNFPLPAVNRANCISTITTNRTVSCCARLLVDFPQTATGPLLTYTRVNGLQSSTSSDNWTNAIILGFPQTRQFVSKDGGSVIQTNWFPSDPIDFSFSLNTVFSNGDGIYNPIFLMATGLPSGSRCTLNVLAFLEGQTGNQQLAPTINNQSAIQPFSPTVADAHKTSDSMWRKLGEIAGQTADAICYGVNLANRTFEVIDSVTQNIQSNQRSNKAVRKERRLQIDEIKE
jgi:hypothetical protein